MNYLAHGARFLDAPYFLAGTAVPDWLSVVDRKVRVRRPAAAALADDDDADAAMQAVAAGILQHLEDDRWFHQTRVFAETTLQFSLQLRELLPVDEGFRPSFLGHIVVEILIDSSLMLKEPSLADRYYEALSGIAPEKVQQVVNRIARVSTDQLESWISRFLDVRFLYDYLDDDKLLFRLEQVMRRVGLPPLGEQLLEWLPTARAIVTDRCDLLLTSPDTSPHRQLTHPQLRNPTP
jgi:hypothetical protein